MEQPSRDTQLGESKTEREERKGSRALQSQATARNPREDTLQPHLKRNKFTGGKQASQSPDKLALVNKIE